MVSDTRLFVQSQAGGMIHAPKGDGSSVPACKVIAVNWRMLLLTPEGFRQRAAVFGVCRICRRLRPLWFVTYPKTVQTWALNDE